MRIFKHYISWHVLFLVFADWAIIFGSVYASLFVKPLGFQPLWLGPDPVYPKVLVCIFIAITMFYIGNLYDLSFHTRKRELIARITLAFLGTAFILAAVSFFFSPLQLSRKVYFLSLGLSLPMVVCFRLFYYWAIKIDQLQEKVLIVGNTTIAQTILGELESDNNPGFAVLGLVTEDHMASRQNDNIRNFVVLRPGSENSTNSLEKYR